MHVEHLNHNITSTLRQTSCVINCCVPFHPPKSIWNMDFRNTSKANVKSRLNWEENSGNNNDNGYTLSYRSCSGKGVVWRNDDCHHICCQLHCLEKWIICVQLKMRMRDLRFVPPRATSSQISECIVSKYIYVCAHGRGGGSQIVPCSPSTGISACGTSSCSGGSNTGSSSIGWINTCLFGCSIWQIAECPQTVLDQTLTGTCKMLAQSLHTTWTQM